MASLLSRVAGAAVSQVRAFGEGFVEQANESARRAAEIEAKRNSRSFGEDLGPKPPEEEYKDLPVTIWANWSLPTIRSALQSHVVGMFQQSSLLVESMLADDRIQAAVNGRIKNVTKCEWSWEPAKSGKRQLKDIEEFWPDFLNEEITETILLWATFMGFALCEVIWDNRDDLWIPRLKFWHPLYVYYRIDLRKYVVITADAGTLEIDEGDPKWFLYVPWGSYRGWVRGAVRSCANPWIVRQYALRDWARFSEVHGLPIKKLMVPSQAPAPDKARFFASVKNLGSESIFSLPQQGDGKGGVGPSFDVQLLEATDQAWKAFPGLIAQCESSITLAIRGTNLTTEVKGGSYAAAETHKDEDSDYAIADRRKLAASVYHQILKPFCQYNYGNPKLAPKPILASQESDQEKETKVLLQAAQSLLPFEEANWPIDRKASADKFGIPLRADVEANKPIEHVELQQDAEKAGLERAVKLGTSDADGTSGKLDQDGGKPTGDGESDSESGDDDSKPVAE